MDNSTSVIISLSKDPSPGCSGESENIDNSNAPMDPWQLALIIILSGLVFLAIVFIVVSCSVTSIRKQIYPFARGKRETKAKKERRQEMNKNM